MTAPLKHSDSITVDVALGDRAYDIVIGRDVLKSLGARVAALRPGTRTAIVTDRTVAKHWLEKTEASLAEAGIATSRDGRFLYIAENLGDSLAVVDIARREVVQRMPTDRTGASTSFNRAPPGPDPCSREEKLVVVSARGHNL